MTSIPGVQNFWLILETGFYFVAGSCCREAGVLDWAVVCFAKVPLSFIFVEPFNRVWNFSEFSVEAILRAVVSACFPVIRMRGVTAWMEAEVSLPEVVNCSSGGRRLCLNATLDLGDVSIWFKMVPRSSYGHFRVDFFRSWGRGLFFVVEEKYDF